MLEIDCWCHGDVNVDKVLLAEWGVQEEEGDSVGAAAAALTGFRFRNEVPDVVSLVLALLLAVGEAGTVGCFLVKAIVV